MVGGYWADNTATQGKFTLMTVPKSGHFIPYNFYDTSKAVLDDMVVNGTLSCHKSDGTCKMNTQMCNHMNQNNGAQHGLCNSEGFYQCEAGWTGADCSIWPV